MIFMILSMLLFPCITLSFVIIHTSSLTWININPEITKLINDNYKKFQFRQYITHLKICTQQIIETTKRMSRSNAVSRHPRDLKGLAGNEI